LSCKSRNGWNSAISATLVKLPTSSREYREVKNDYVFMYPRNHVII
jgi:hypothetical protein